MNPKWTVIGLMCLGCLGCNASDEDDQPAEDTSAKETEDTGLTSTDCEPPAESLPPDEDLAGLPPLVVRTVPAHLDWEVDPATQAIEVTFSQDMGSGRAWLSLDPALYPEHGEATWIDARTDRLEVTLEPDRTYLVGLNGFGFDGFYSTDGVVALPHILVFHTRAE